MFDTREIFMLLFCFALIGAYHMFLMNQIKNDPSHTVFGFGKQVRRAWVVKIMSSDKHALLGVQTMRNELLVGQFLAQASFVALSLVVGAASGTNLLARIDEWVASDPIAGRDLEHASAVVRLGVLSSILGSIFINSVQSLRLIRHVSMYLGIKDAGSSGADNENLTQLVSEKYELSVVYNWWAMRGMMMLIPSVSWLFGVTYAAVTTTLCVGFLACVDNLNMGEKKLFEQTRGRINQHHHYHHHQIRGPWNDLTMIGTTPIRRSVEHVSQPSEMPPVAAGRSREI